MTEHRDKKKWTDLAAKELRGKEVDSLNWMTPEGIQAQEDIDKGMNCLQIL